jgi:hypothetical protein
VIARLKQLPMDLHREVDRRRTLAEERADFRRAGAQLALATDAPVDRLNPLHEEIRRVTATLNSLAAERRAVAEADLRDLERVSWWIQPAVMVRSVSSRMVLQHDRRRAERCLDAAHEALGRAAALGGQDAGGPRKAPSSEAALPWSERLVVEARGFFAAVGVQLRGHLFPKGPALVGMVVGWWIANTYTDSHVRSVLRTVGIGSGGTHVVSGSTYRAMSFWMPLLAAALCAYLGERAWERLVGRKE